MGIPGDWNRVEKWLYGYQKFDSFITQKAANKVLCPDLPILEDYTKKADSTYWDKFPKNSIPTMPESDIKADALSSIISEKENLLLDSEIVRARASVVNLTQGASSFQNSNLGPCFEKNASGIEKYGKEVADAIASWVKRLCSGSVVDPNPNPK
jgi:hypothetical protein